ncbi:MULTISPECIES: YciI family protein [Streptomycetaceae]|uniref:YCII-related protein n=1 Tax=Streptantibioticus cattleyicolor (strain ATCC 35852 / DSM 46488 / JCM 4925 / NBRC 14057 / NRRL 8057) TaxID=1003195 RepID=F8JRK3_STREN|nr:MULTISPECIES: YciI family protein [Streptomycetaceae]AEW97890.1 YCII-related protein [Streptantibioticus cattleyicolor NRRL 8057 = DSM 46488]MYS62298.1 hypothetical protein [Streptomyces sp. SID5468]CCB78204.1 conserved protein of unknown function [Streptantibioticus cattleyicolor NRRL 8057 = DSM 46488]
MPLYLLLVYADEEAAEEAGPRTHARTLEEHRAFGRRNATLLRGGHALHPTRTAVSVRHEAPGRVTVTEGPFTGGRTALSGFYAVEAAGLDEAVALAQEVPAPFGGVEVRPVRAFD